MEDTVHDTDRSATHVEPRASLALEPVLDSAAAARHFVRDHLVEWGVPELVDDALLAISELVTNAIVHARSAIDVRLELGSDRLRVEVHDRSGRPALHATGAAASTAAAAAAVADDQTTTGRGLFIVAAVSAGMGERSDDGGKTVWFELDRVRRPTYW